MTVSTGLQWLHISDLHFKINDTYDREVIQNAFLSSISTLKDRGHCADVIFVTGDIANTGHHDEYEIAGQFFDKLLAETGLKREHLFVIPGNHDVSRVDGRYLARTLESVRDSDEYFSPEKSLVHIKTKLRAFTAWHDIYFSGIRKFSSSSSVGYSSEYEKNGVSIRVIGINTAVFCLADDDNGKLWLGRRSLNALPQKSECQETFSVALMHHPLDWCHEAERSSVTTLLRERAHFILRGHLHETDAESVAGLHASALHLAAGALYQTEDWPNRAMFGLLTPEELRIVPIRYERAPKPTWTIDPSVYPEEGHYARAYPHSRPAHRAPTMMHPAPVAPPPSTGPSAARLAFEQDLFNTGRGEKLYAEPRLMDRPPEQAVSDAGDARRVTIEEVVSSTHSYLIEAPREYGATLLSRRLRCEIEEQGYGSVQEYNATKLPNYRKKLQEQFGTTIAGQKRTLILDSFDYTVHERLLKEIVSLGAFDRLIVLVSQSGLRRVATVISGHDDLKFERVFLWGLGRSEIRSLAQILFDTADDALVTSVVDKVYNDLLSLCIPLTPSNVLMYIRVLKREEDFNPINRVDILDRYLTELLRRPSDNTTSSFSAKNKLNLVSQFAYRMFAEGQEFFTESEWRAFCRDYKLQKLCDFDEDDLLGDLRSARVVFGNKSAYYFKYSFFYYYFVGRYLSNNPLSLSAFVSTKSYYNLPGAVETISGLVSDNTALLTSLCDEVESHLSQYFQTYVKEEFDPFTKAIWVDDKDESERFWAPIEKSIESGPKSPQEIDLIKTSLTSEARTVDQQVSFKKFTELEDNIFLIADLLADALKCSDSVDGQLKMRAVSAHQKTSLVVMQVASLLSSVIADNRIVRWGGLVFINWDAKRHDEGDHSGVMWVLQRVCTMVSRRNSELIGVAKLGEVFKAIDSNLPYESFLKLQNFSSILSARPEGWSDKLKRVLEGSDRRGYYFMQMLLILVHSFKHDVYTAGDRQRLKELIAYIRAKRDLKIDAPGNKAVRRVLEHLEERGDFSPATKGE